MIVGLALEMPLPSRAKKRNMWAFFCQKMPLYVSPNFVKISFLTGLPDGLFSSQKSKFG
jgi:hypothetical protein